MNAQLSPQTHSRIDSKATLPFISSPTSAELGAETDLKEVLLLMETLADQMRTHPLQTVFRSPTPPRSLVLEFAGIQYVDSVLWVPMLAIMKDRARHPTLVKALLDNLLCEAGANHESHVMLCQRFIKSIGISPYYGDFRQYSELAGHPIAIMNGVSGMSELQIAGFNLMSEAMVPHLFKLALPAFQAIPGADCQYLTDHISVDADDHANAMIQAVRDLLIDGASVGEIMEGMHLSARTALSIPDALYAKFLRSAETGAQARAGVTS
jgi:pyrroloquinoline quinone (PQQ) biosynthesis protein C